MAVVISSEESNYFSSGPLKRSQSGRFAPSLPTPPQPKSRSTTHLPSRYQLIHSPSNSPQSSHPSSPRTSIADSVAPSFNSTPSSSVFLDNCDESEDEDQIVFPSYDTVGYYGQAEDLEPAPSPHGTGGSYTVSPTSNSTSTNLSRAHSPEPVEHAEDDSAVREQPSRHVDYLSHNWKEEDIWSSWKHIVSKKGAYNNSARLENASWRTWIKAKNNLKTVSPEALNWLKDCDVTWLYGPLQTASDKALRLGDHSPYGDTKISKTNSFVHGMSEMKKPILKKRSMSELMLQRSISSSSLLKQAAASVQAQQSERPLLGRATSDYVYAFSSRLSRENTSLLPSASSSGYGTPGSNERKHIHFNEQVEQCIALDMKGDEDEEPDPYAVQDDFDSDSDDGGIMMKRSASARKLPLPGGKNRTPRNSFSTNVPEPPPTIAKLPSTNLKYRGDTPEPPETAMKHSNAFWTSGKLSPSPSQETLRPSRPSQNILLADDDDDDDIDMNWVPPSAFANRKDSVSVTNDRMNGLHASDSSSSLTGEPSGMRRTPSGMFMPYEEDEDDVVSEGLFGKVVDTVNTARDIAHVIWNVGWRR